MLVEVSTVRNRKMAIQAVPVVLTQLLWGMHSNVLFHCVILCAWATQQAASSGTYWGTAEWERNSLSLWDAP